MVIVELEKTEEYTKPFQLQSKNGGTKTEDCNRPMLKN